MTRYPSPPLLGEWAIPRGWLTKVTLMVSLRRLCQLAIVFSLWIYLLSPAEANVLLPYLNNTNISTFSFSASSAPLRFLNQQSCIGTGGVSTEPIKVVTTTSELKSLVQIVGGEQVEVTSIALPAQDPHTFEPRLANLQQLKGAKLVVKIGLDHDLWIDRLLQETGDPSLQRGGKGYVDASTGIPLLEVRSISLAPTSGHTHGAGNPHYWLDPLNAETITGAIMDGLMRVDPDHGRFYQANRAAFLTQLKAKIADWKSKLATFQGLPIVAYHNSWPYLARRFRLNIIDYIEPKPGVPAAPTRLASLIREMKNQQVVPLIIKEPYESEQIPQLLSRKTGAKILTLISSVGAIPEVPDYFSLFDYNVNALVQALESK